MLTQKKARCVGVRAILIRSTYRDEFFDEVQKYVQVKC